MVDVYLQFKDRDSDDIVNEVLKLFDWYHGKFYSQLGITERNGINTRLYEFPGFNYVSLQYSTQLMVSAVNTDKLPSCKITLLGSGWDKNNSLYRELCDLRK